MTTTLVVETHCYNPVYRYVQSHIGYDYVTYIRYPRRSVEGCLGSISTRMDKLNTVV